MARKKLTAIDFQFGVGQIIPSTQEAFREKVPDISIRRSEQEHLKTFKETLIRKLDQALEHEAKFPTSQEVFVFILQYFAGEKEYRRRDIDNISKTILDVLKNRTYHDDSQVKTLLVGKKIDRRISQDFAYVAIKELRNDQDVDALKISGIERSITLFQELKSKKLL